MKQKDYIKLTGLIFTGVAAVHVWRLLSGWDIELGDIELPYWLSFLGVAAAGFLAYTSQRLKK